MSGVSSTTVIERPDGTLEYWEPTLADIQGAGLDPADTEQIAEITAFVNLRNALNHGREAHEKRLRDEEQDRLQIEQDRLQIEQDRLQIEQNRLHIEQNHLQIEQNRLHIEQNYLQIEQNRLELEQDRIQFEQDHLELEQNRKTTDDLIARLDKEIAEVNAIWDDCDRLRARSRHFLIILDYVEKAKQEGKEPTKDVLLSLMNEDIMAGQRGQKCD
ncbi:hypothetical protein BV25DRAFT_1916762 [Artomyces pyxidatus]|uniref:Uncharacterized protein n=1 Tax=Artomyces pyxidatus TaxID=48021 RepID=A0ACB8SZ54_9AGAM|nr:hypothetical protein BV25DRAFT_1916762 [Artomyces pyxidatus]